MSNDAQKLQDAAFAIHTLWGSPVLIVVIIGLMWSQVRYHAHRYCIADHLIWQTCRLARAQLSALAWLLCSSPKLIPAGKTGVALAPYDHATLCLAPCLPSLLPLPLPLTPLIGWLGFDGVPGRCHPSHPHDLMAVGKAGVLPARAAAVDRQARWPDVGDHHGHPGVEVQSV